MTDSISGSESELDFLFYRDYLHRQVDQQYDLREFWAEMIFVFKSDLIREKWGW